MPNLPFGVLNIPYDFGIKQLFEFLLWCQNMKKIAFQNSLLVEKLGGKHFKMRFVKKIELDLKQRGPQILKI